MIDIVVTKLQETSMWHRIPPGTAVRIISALKAPYEKVFTPTYSRAQATSLMEFTGLKLGEGTEIPLPAHCSEETGNEIGQGYRSGFRYLPDLP